MRYGLGEQALVVRREGRTEQLSGNLPRVPEKRMEWHSHWKGWRVLCRRVLYVVSSDCQLRCDGILARAIR